MEEHKLGTYAGFKLSDSSLDVLENLQNQLKLENKTLREKLHITLLYSRKHLPDYVPLGEVYTLVSLGEFRIFETQSGKSALVVTLSDPYKSINPLIYRHNKLMKQHDATWDYESYIPHITLSYDVGPDFNIDLIELPPKNYYDGNLEVVFEYKEDLDLDWSAESKEEYLPQESKEFPGFYRIPGYSKHLASEKGEILTKKTGNSTLGGIAGTYRKVKVYKDGSKDPELQYAHILVCRAFYGPPTKGQVVLHKDNDCTNNKKSNLSWGTQSDNIKQMWRSGAREINMESFLDILNFFKSKKFNPKNINELIAFINKNYANRQWLNKLVFKQGDIKNGSIGQVIHIGGKTNNFILLKFFESMEKDLKKLVSVLHKHDLKIANFNKKFYKIVDNDHYGEKFSYGRIESINILKSDVEKELIRIYSDRKNLLDNELSILNYSFRENSEMNFSLSLPTNSNTTSHVEPIDERTCLKTAQVIINILKIYMNLQKIFDNVYEDTYDIDSEEILDEYLSSAKVSKETKKSIEFLEKSISPTNITTMQDIHNYLTPILFKSLKTFNDWLQYSVEKKSFSTESFPISSRW